MENITTLINNHNLVKKVQYILIAIFLIIIGLDIYLALDSAEGNTISNVIQNHTDNGLFVLTYFWGCIAANLFFTIKNEPLVNSNIGTLIVIAIAFLMILFNVEPLVDDFFKNHNYNISIYSISMILGFSIGMVFWRQQHATYQ